MEPQVNNMWAFIQKGLLLAFSFADDVALMVLARLGFNWPWLQWVGTLLLIMTLLYWIIRVLSRQSSKHL